MSEEKSYPSLFEQGKNLAKFSWKLLKHINEKISIDGIESLLVTTEIYNQRIEICKSCPKFDEKKIKCTECGCYLPVKAKVLFDDCPLDKWGMDDKEWEDIFENIVGDIENKKTNE